MALNDVSEGGGSGLVEVTTKTITVKSANTPGYDGKLEGISTEQAKSLKEPDIYPDPNSTHPAATFSVNFDTAYEWDETNSHTDLYITGNWDTNPGSDVTYKVEVNEV